MERLIQCGVSTTLFNIILDFVIKEVKGDIEKLQVGCIDIVYRYKKQQRSTANFKNMEIQGLNLKIDIENTKTMIIM